jgi:hypothetical protein
MATTTAYFLKSIGWLFVIGFIKGEEGGTVSAISFSSPLVLTGGVGKGSTGVG